MSNPTWIYPQWYKARRDLIDALKLTPDQASILTRWFENHVFEFGQDYMMGPAMIESKISQIDLMAMAEERCLSEIVRSLHRKGLFLKEVTNQGYLGTNLRMTMLIAGCPPFVGREERNDGLEDFKPEDGYKNLTAEMYHAMAGGFEVKITPTPSGIVFVNLNDVASPIVIAGHERETKKLSEMENSVRGVGGELAEMIKTCRNKLERERRDAKHAKS